MTKSSNVFEKKNIGSSVEDFLKKKKTTLTTMMYLIKSLMSTQNMRGWDQLFKALLRSRQHWEGRLELSEVTVGGAVNWKCSWDLLGWSTAALEDHLWCSNWSRWDLPSTTTVYPTLVVCSFVILNKLLIRTVSKVDTNYFTVSTYKTVT